MRRLIKVVGLLLYGACNSASFAAAPPNLDSVERELAMVAAKSAEAGSAHAELGKDVSIDGSTVICRPIVRASDINRYFSAHPNASLVTVRANTFFIDEDINRSDNSTSFKIDLTGGNDSDGATGSAGGTDAVGGDDGPGKLGQNGGNFFGYGFKFLGVDSLTIKSKGGRGGDGGTSGRGGNGSDAKY